jgi:ribosome-associated heat shock protein Hsp15
LARNEPLTAVRLDKWLWCARFYKTRALAAEAIKGNKIKVNSLAVKSAKNIKIRDEAIIKKPPFEYHITILKLTNNRLSASLATELYQEDKNSIQKREEIANQIKADSASFPKTIGRPTKRDRRKIISFTRDTQKSEDN